MNDLISRQAAMNGIREIASCCDVGHEPEDYVYMLQNLPSAQSEIIRCKDCKNWDTTWQNNWAKNYYYCPMIDGTINGDWYCADAERREE